jgi:hypothetical protein
VNAGGVDERDDAETDEEEEEADEDEDSAVCCRDGEDAKTERVRAESKTSHETCHSHCSTHRRTKTLRYGLLRTKHKTNTHV